MSVRRTEVQRDSDSAGRGNESPIQIFYQRDLASAKSARLHPRGIEMAAPWRLDCGCNTSAMKMHQIRGYALCGFGCGLAT